MEHKASLLQQVISTEWEMFRTVNGDRYVDCQQDPETFAGMRTAQFRAWPPEALRSYANDLAEAKRAGRNLLREKYIRMMRSTEPETYALLRRELPEDTPEGFRDTLEQVLGLGAENITVHTLSLKKGSRILLEVRVLFISIPPPPGVERYPFGLL